MTYLAIDPADDEYFQTEYMKKMVKDIMRPVVDVTYDEIYPYIWFICIYNIFLICVALANLYILLKVLRRVQTLA